MLPHSFWFMGVEDVRKCLAVSRTWKDAVEEFLEEVARMLEEQEIKDYRNVGNGSETDLPHRPRITTYRLPR